MPQIDPRNASVDAGLSKMLDEWTAAQNQATYWTGKEKELREAIFARCFPNPEEGAGNHFRLPFDKTLVGDHRLTYTVDKDALANIMADKKSNARAVAERIINYRPEVKKTEFRGLERDEMLLVADLVTIKPGLPGLALKTTSKMRKRK